MSDNSNINPNSAPNAGAQLPPPGGIPTRTTPPRSGTGTVRSGPRTRQWQADAAALAFTSPAGAAARTAVLTPFN
ncbi:MAG: hypothetical protein K0S70_2016 [Microbacterium sp.]|jgi:hypothetical protein|nr:hypothetical protein [Microbacterium sp.]